MWCDQYNLNVHKYYEKKGGLYVLVIMYIKLIEKVGFIVWGKSKKMLLALSAGSFFLYAGISVNAAEANEFEKVGYNKSHVSFNENVLNLAL